MVENVQVSGFQSPRITAAVSALMGSTINNQLKSWSSKKNWVAQWNNFVLVRSTVTLCCLSQQSLSNRLMPSPIRKMVDTARDQVLINNVAGRASLCPPGYLRRVEEKFVGGLALTFSARPLSVWVANSHVDSVTLFRSMILLCQRSSHFSNN